MKTLAIDLETFSTAPIGSGGVYRYAADDGFDILLFAYSEDGGPVHLVDLASGEELPPRIRDALTDPSVEKWAFNAQFERVCLSHWLGIDGYLDPAQWRCSMVWASALGLPRSLKHVAETLNLDAQKLDSGTRLINFFCEPVRLSETQQASLFSDTGKTYRRRQPVESPEKWEQFREYNIRDVVVENQLRDKLSGFPLPDWVWDEYALDQRINDRGIRLDADFAQAAINADEAHRDSLMNEAKHLTGLDNPGSPAQLKAWLEEHGCDIPSLAKADVDQAISTTSGTTRRVLELRQELSRSSTKKYEAMLKALCPDGRAHGLIQYYGAGRTGRWAGRLIQVQNLPRNYLPDLDDARQLVKAGEAEAVELLYGSLPDTLSQLIRTAFVPREGTRFIVADYSAIEARVLAWLAGEAKTLSAFAQGKDLYCETASGMFGVPVEKHGQNAELRQKGKIATLACGYQGGVGAIKAMGGERMGLDEQEMKHIVDAWRQANPNITQYWWDIDQAAKDAITTGEPQHIRNITLHTERGMLFITLPSGRRLAYAKPAIGTNRFGGDSITCFGIGTNRKFEKQETYGGKLVENITQAVARDLLSHSITLLEKTGHDIVMHIHDEVVIEAPPETTVDEVCDLMSQAPQWADGIPLTADGYECNYYMKD